MNKFHPGIYYIATVRNNEVRMYKGTFLMSVCKIVMDRKLTPESQQIGLELFSQIPEEKFLLSAGTTEDQAWEKFIAKQQEKINANIQATDQIIQWKQYAERQRNKSKRTDAIRQYLAQNRYEDMTIDQIAEGLEEHLGERLK